MKFRNENNTLFRHISGYDKPTNESCFTIIIIILNFE